MTEVYPTDSRSTALAALAWLVDAGVDTLVEAAPRNWLAAPVASLLVAAPPSETVAPARRVHQPEPKPEPGNTALTAALGAADTLPALAEALAQWRGAAPMFADGDPAAGVMVLGAMPSPDDVAEGRLFAGTAGRLLDRMIAAIGRDRTNTYLANVLHWPTPGGRNAERDELAAALPIVRRHIALARPRALLVLGGPAAAALLGVEQGINRLRGQWQTLTIDDASVAVLPSFHPDYLLAHPAHKALAWRDLQIFEAALTA
jgi:uracil-DNA glycosylase